MATYLENLTTARDNVAANLAAMTASPKPTYSVDGESYSWSELFSTYTQQLEALEKAIQRASGPFVVRSRARG